MEALGIDPKSILIQIASFALFYFLFTRFLLSPIVKILDERKKKIAKGLEEAEKAHMELAKIDEMTNEAKKRLKVEERKMLDSAKVESEKLKDEILADARTKAQKIMNDAQANLKSIEAQFIQEAENNQLKLVDAIIQKVLPDEMSDVEVKARYQKVMNSLRAK